MEKKGKNKHNEKVIKKLPKEKDKTTKTKEKTTKTNHVITDDDTTIVFDKNYEWEIERDLTKEFYYSNDKQLNKNSGKFVRFVNHRKARGWEGELVTLYDDGKRICHFLYGVFGTNPDEAKAYLAEENLTKEIMEFEFEKKKREEIAKQKKEDRKKKKKGSSGKNKKTKTIIDAEGNNLPLIENLVTPPVPNLVIVPIQSDVTEKP